MNHDPRAAMIVRMDDRGRVVLPQIIRESLRVEPGDTFYARVDEQGVRFERIVPPSDENVTEDDWLKAAARLGTYDFLADDEDLYSLEDGKPISDET